MAPPAPPAAASGLPQFDLAQWPGQIVWALAIFAVLYLLLARVFLPRVGDTIAEREDTISGQIGDARRLRDEAAAEAEVARDEITAARNRARKLAQDAAAEANAAADKRRAEEDERLGATLAAADDRIALAKASAMAEVRGLAADTAGAIVGKLTGAAPSAREIEAALAAGTA